MEKSTIDTKKNIVLAKPPIRHNKVVAAFVFRSTTGLDELAKTKVFFLENGDINIERLLYSKFDLSPSYVALKSFNGMTLWFEGIGFKGESFCAIIQGLATIGFKKTFSDILKHV